MIEIICNGDADDENGKTSTNRNIRIPKNIKQIGDVSSERIIYIEDYAFTYINSLAYGAQDDEQAGVLLGECIKTDSEKCVFIKGVIKAKPEEDSKKDTFFDEKIWKRIYEEIEKYFADLQVVGWFVSLPDVTPERMQYLRRVHMDNFAGDMKTMYVVNTTDKEEHFYLYENGELKRQSGYVCFYERNYEMQEYMMEKRGRRSVESPQKDKVMTSIRTVLKEKEEEKKNKKNGAISYGVCTFMAVVIFVLGINLISNYEKMRRLDNSINNISKEIATLSGSTDVVEVNKIDGNVYPTEAETTGIKGEESETAGDNVVVDADVSQNSTEGNSTETVKETVTDSTKETENQATEASNQIVAYEVQKGETLISICRKYYGDASKVNEVAELNGIKDIDKVNVGQIIKLP